MNQEFELQYVSSMTLRVDESEFLLIYKDAQGKLEFSGLERHSHPMLYAPSAREWDSLLPARKGQRDLVIDRLLTHFRADPAFDSYRKSLKDPNFFVHFPDEGARLRSRWMAVAGFDRPAAADRPGAKTRWTLSMVVLCAAVAALTAAPSAMRAWRQWHKPPSVLTPAAVMRFEGVESPPNDLVYLPEGKSTISVVLDPLAGYSGLRCEERNDGGRPAGKLMVNARALSGFDRAPREFPVDSVIFKLLDPSPPRRTRVVAMRKRELGYDPKNGDWSYLSGESFKPYESGRVDRCIACHAKAAANDYVFNGLPLQ